MGVVAKLETDLVDVATKVKAGIEAAGADAVKVASFLSNNGAEITALASLAGPQAAAVAGVGENLLTLAINAVKDAGDAASANGLTVSLDSQVIADVKAVIAAIEKI